MLKYWSIWKRREKSNDNNNIDTTNNNNNNNWSKNNTLQLPWPVEHWSSLVALEVSERHFYDQFYSDQYWVIDESSLFPSLRDFVFLVIWQQPKSHIPIWEKKKSYFSIHLPAFSILHFIKISKPFSFSE